MNIKNNKRRQATREKIEAIFVDLLQKKEITQITVSDICKKADINRSTFYSNYEDIYQLADKIKEALEKEVNDLYNGNTANAVGLNYLSLFQHIKENQLFYKTYFKLGYDTKYPIDINQLNEKSRKYFGDYLEYHVEFHKAGLNTIIKKWLSGGCVEDPEEMVKIIKKEYKGRDVI